MYFFRIGLFFSVLLLIGCSERTSDKMESVGTEPKNTDSPLPLEVVKDSLPQKSSPIYYVPPSGLDTLVEITRFNSNIQWQLKYASSDNFMHRKLYDTIRRMYAQLDVAKRLGNSQRLLEKLKPGYFLLVYDAVRPLSVQWEMWNALDTIPTSERGKFVSNPANGSVHNYGAALDLTICDEVGEPLDMGAKYDDIRTIAYPSLEAEFLKKGLLTKEQVANRKLLRQVMKSQGFSNIPTEWWHFNGCSRDVAKKRYKVIKDEF